MESILQQLYDASSFEQPPSDECRAWADKLEPYFTRLRAELGQEFEEEFRSVLYDAESQECREWFQLGGALTGRLLWELFVGPPPRLYF